MPDWVIWAIAAVALGIGEIFTPGLFFLGPVALAAVAAALMALIGLGLVVQLIVFQHPYRDGGPRRAQGSCRPARRLARRARPHRR